MKLISRFFKPPKTSYFLFGPRGTGKSTWLKNRYPSCIWIDLLEPDQLRFYSSFPERLRETLEVRPDEKIVIIDEIQKVPELLPLIHAIIEEKKGYQFILTGSSARKLRKVGVDLLAGRALLEKMHPFYAGELGVEFKLEKALILGTLPLVWDAENPGTVLKTYAGMYLKEEVQAEGLVRQVGDFARFMEIMAFSHGQILNASNIARECQISRKTVESYLQILDDLLLSFTLRVFTKRAKREMTTHPKFYFFDTGVFQSLRTLGPVDKREEIDGAALEGLVAQHLRAWVDAQHENWNLSFWRTHTQIEVDFVIYGPTGFWAIEVKNKRDLSLWDTKGLEAFGEDFPESERILLYRGKRKFIQRGVLCMPCEEFLLQIAPDLPLYKRIG
jgi:predicted AAA+ superfamily ATPase